MKPTHRKPTPIRTALFWISTTSCCWMAALLYSVYDGQVVPTGSYQLVATEASHWPSQEQQDELTAYLSEHGQ